MTVTELIGLLEDCSPNDEVHFALVQYRCSLQYGISDVFQHETAGVFLGPGEEKYLASGVEENL